MKSPTLLSFNNGRTKPIAPKNLQTLYQASSSTYTREILDEVEPKDIKDSFLNIF
ncbi:MAG: hypothetical protein JSS09_01675 [Verrucomicrobia bacterium]|nr:hypothetical protein [Verrucomicrobiota bacterium]